MRKIDRQEWDRLLRRLDLHEGAPLAMVLDEVHCKLDELSEANHEGFRLAGRIGDLEGAEHPPDEMAARLVHASHGSACRVDLSLCPHPDCERLWRAT